MQLKSNIFYQVWYLSVSCCVIWGVIYGCCKISTNKNYTWPSPIHNFYSQVMNLGQCHLGLVLWHWQHITWFPEVYYIKKERNILVILRNSVKKNVLWYNDKIWGEYVFSNDCVGSFALFRQIYIPIFLSGRKFLRRLFKFFIFYFIWHASITAMVL